MYINTQTNDNALIELQQHLRFESLLAELSANFVRVPADRIDYEIQESLRQIAENLELDHITIGEITPDGADFTSSYHYVKPGTGMKPWEGMSLMMEAPLIVQKALLGQPFIMHDIDQLPPEAYIDRQGFSRYGIRANLVFPFFIGGCIRGGIGFASARPREWPDSVQRGLHLISDVFANVLSRKRASEALHENEEHLRLASDAADVALWVWDMPQDRIWVTDKTKEIYGISTADEFNLQRFLDCLVPEDRDRVRQSIERVKLNGGHFRDEYRISHVDGGIHWICASGRCQVNASGVPVRLMGASVDVTENRNIKFELEQSNQELTRALNEIQSLKEQLQQENIYLKREIAGRQKLGPIVHQSEEMRRILAQVEVVASTSASVMITGETGTGKELIAAAIHQASTRRDKPMIRVNCAAIPAALIESELFGREKGAYTGALAKQIGRFELANASTIFLDEIGEISLDAQAKLLRVLQEKEIERLGNPNPIKVDVRVIAATNRSLAKEVAEGRFREDLYYRLNVFPVHIPPLRERREDIPGLVETFVEEFAKTIGKPIDAVAKSSLKVLRNYDWPGNIRELRNVIERAVILTKGPILKIDLPSESLAMPDTAKFGLIPLEQVERNHITHVLVSAGWRIRGKAGAAEILGMKPSTLESRMLKLGIKRPTLK